jgi:hypothetical protein
MRTTKVRGFFAIVSAAVATGMGISGDARAGDVLYTSVIPNFGTELTVYQCRALNASTKPVDITIQMLNAQTGGSLTAPRLCEAAPGGVNCVDFFYVEPPTVVDVYCKIETSGKREQIRGSLIAREYDTNTLLAIVEAR